MFFRLRRLIYRWSIKETYLLNRLNYPNYEKLKEVRRTRVATKNTCHNFFIKIDKVNKWGSVPTLLPLHYYTIELKSCKEEGEDGLVYKDKILIISKFGNWWTFRTGLVDYVIDLYLNELTKQDESKDSFTIIT